MALGAPTSRTCRTTSRSQTSRSPRGCLNLREVDTPQSELTRRRLVMKKAALAMDIF
jgi:hypothetical protein